MKKKNLPLLTNITITDVAAEGKALCRIQTANADGVQSTDLVCFVPYCVPGDVVDLQVTRKKHSFMEARVARLITPSPKRCEARCRHYGVCGGCKWQILPYEEQLIWKQRQVEDNLRRIGHVELPPISPILGSNEIYEYRNKLEFTFADHQWLTPEEMKQGIPFTPGLGFHIPNCFDKVLHIDTCHLMPEINNRIRHLIYEQAQALELTFYNERSHTGDLRNLILRSNHKGELMLVLVFGAPVTQAGIQLLETIHKAFPEIVSLQYVLNLKLNDTIGDLDVQVYSGQDHLMEEMEGLQFKVGPKSFYQTNTRQAYELYKVARRFAFDERWLSDTGRLSNGQRPLVYDLYTGTGTIANFVAKQASKVIGIEYVPEAIEDAKVNAELNGLSHKTEFYAGDMKDILTADFIREHGHPDVIITDPPRAGMHEDVVNVIIGANPKRIVYVSCNPATQARDLNLLDAHYRVAEVQPVDMFPHTQHVENVVLLERRN